MTQRKNTRGSRNACAGHARPSLALSIAAVLLALLPSCKFVDLTAPLEASMSISANPMFIDIGERSTITVLVSKDDGTPVPDETVVTFTTTMGTIPQRANTRGGLAQVELISGDQVGVATVTARSGTTANEVFVDIAIGTVPAVIQNISLSANPSSLGPNGGFSSISAVAFGDDGEPLANAPVVFSANAGTLASGGALLRTGSNGEARDTLTTDRSTTVTVTSGVVSASITVEVEVTDNQPPQALLVASPTNPTVGQLVNFNASASSDPDGTIVSFAWDFGDGDTASGERVTHSYETANSFNVLLVVTDDQGTKASATLLITVSPAQTVTTADGGALFR
jgi:hypothetical protein